MSVGASHSRERAWVLGSSIVFRRNANYYGEAPFWDSVNWRVIANPGSRTAALQAGDVDLIDQVSTHDVALLQKDSKLTLAAPPDQRLMYIAVDSGRDVTPFAFDNAGKQLATAYLPALGR